MGASSRGQDLVGFRRQRGWMRMSGATRAGCLYRGPRSAIETGPECELQTCRSSITSHKHLARRWKLSVLRVLWSNRAAQAKPQESKQQEAYWDDSAAAWSFHLYQFGWWYAWDCTLRHMFHHF